MNYKYLKNIKMKNIGYNTYLDNQEEFVENNKDNLLNYLLNNSRISYNKGQIEAKLRQLYANCDNNEKNRGTYINNNDWDNVKIYFKFK